MNNLKQLLNVLMLLSGLSLSLPVMAEVDSPKPLSFQTAKTILKMPDINILLQGLPEAQK